MPEANETRGRTPVIRLILAWSLVGIPLLWGVAQTFIRSLALFD
jgi:hypothetical protein